MVFYAMIYGPKINNSFFFIWCFTKMRKYEYENLLKIQLYDDVSHVQHTKYFNLFSRASFWPEYINFYCVWNNFFRCFTPIPHMMDGLGYIHMFHVASKWTFLCLRHEIWPKSWLNRLHASLFLFLVAPPRNMVPI